MVGVLLDANGQAESLHSQSRPDGSVPVYSARAFGLAFTVLLAQHALALLQSCAIATRI
jgi:hypothetical protein